MFTKSLIASYLKYYEDRWTEKTIKCKKAMFSTLLDQVGKGSVDATFAWVDTHLAPYSRRTYLSLVSDYYQWLIDQGHKDGDNPIRKRLLRQSNKYKYRNVYKRKVTGVSFEEAKSRIETIEDSEVRTAALTLLTTGLRLDELYNVRSGVVHGKYNQERAFVGESYKLPEVHPNTIRNHLKKLGLKPHDLRKAFATKIIDSGLSLPDTSSVMGWKSYRTAAVYYQPKVDQKLKDLVKGALL